jgi:hypothetical protein
MIIVEEVYSLEIRIIIQFENCCISSFGASLYKYAGPRF